MNYRIKRQQAPLFLSPSSLSFSLAQYLSGVTYFLHSTTITMFWYWNFDRDLYFWFLQTCRVKTTKPQVNCFLPCTFVFISEVWENLVRVRIITQQKDFLRFWVRFKWESYNNWPTIYAIVISVFTLFSFVHAIHTIMYSNGMCMQY